MDSPIQFISVYLFEEVLFQDWKLLLYPIALIHLSCILTAVCACLLLRWRRL